MAPSTKLAEFARMVRHLLDEGLEIPEATRKAAMMKGFTKNEMYAAMFDKALWGQES